MTAAAESTCPPTDSATDATPMPLERVEARLVELSSQIAGATYELLCLVAQFDDANGAQQWGLATTAHWLSWKCSVGMTAAREQVRVARKLVLFPALVAEFKAGRLSYSKVRSITRIAADDTIDTLISLARSSTAAQLDRIVAGYRRSTRDRDTQAQRATRQLTYRWDEDGTLVGSFRLPPDTGARFIAALEAAKAVLPEPVAEAEQIEDDAMPPCEECIETAEAQHAELPCELIGDHDCTEFAIRSAHATCVHTSAEALAAHRPRKSMADALSFLADRGIDWLTRHADPDADLGLPGIGRDERFQLVIHTSAEASGAHGGTGMFDDAQLESGHRLDPATARRLVCGCPWSIQLDHPYDNPLHLGRKARRARARLARAVHHRDGGHCQAPGCTNRTAVIHHIIHWADGGVTCIENLISLCDAHHWLMHEGGWSITTLNAGRWLFQRPDGSPMSTVIGAPINCAPLPFDPNIAGDAITGDWDGTASIDDAVWALANLGRAAQVIPSN